jgi:hypothetical protein
MAAESVLVVLGTTWREHLPALDLLCLRGVSRILRKKIPLGLVVDRIGVSVPDGTDKVDFVGRLWFVLLLEQWDIAFVRKTLPFFRVRNSLTHVVQGFARSMYYNGTWIEGTLIMEVQPTFSWSKSQTGREKKRTVRASVRKGLLSTPSCDCIVG